MNIKKLACISASFVFACAFLTACKGNEDETLILPIYDAAEPNYSTVEAYVGTISEYKRVSGNFSTPYSQAAAFTAVGGYLESLHVRAEMTVNQGDIIAVLRDSDLEDRISEQKLRLDSAKNTLDTLKANDGDGDEIAYAEIDYEIEQIAYNSLVEKREELTLYAPISGKVSWVSNINIGDYVNTGNTICMINDTSREYIVCSSEYIGSQSFGTNVTIKQGAIAECTGTVIDMVSSRYGSDLIVISAETEDAGFMDFGDFEVYFTANRHENTVIIPAGAVKTLGERTFVNVLLNGMKVEVDVETGLSSGNEIEVISGLSGGEQIIIS